MAKKAIKSTKVVETDDIRKRAVSALMTTWATIGYEALAAVAEDQGKHIDSVWMSRADVIDFVTACGISGYPMENGGDTEAIKWLDQQPKSVQNRILKEAFPLNKYGT
jgi:hypothetical protein